MLLDAFGSYSTSMRYMTNGTSIPKCPSFSTYNKKFRSHKLQLPFFPQFLFFINPLPFHKYPFLITIYLSTSRRMSPD